MIAGRGNMPGGKWAGDTGLMRGLDAVQLVVPRTRSRGI